MDYKFKLNDKFSILQDLELAIASYSKEKYVDLHKRDSRTIEQAVKEKKISRERIQNKELKYYQLKYTCLFGGRKNYKGRGEGNRKTKTFECGCPFFIHLVLSDDGEYLVVKKVHEEHDNLNTS